MSNESTLRDTTTAAFDRDELLRRLQKPVGTEKTAAVKAPNKNRTRMIYALSGFILSIAGTTIYYSTVDSKASTEQGSPAPTTPLALPKRALPQPRELTARVVKNETVTDAAEAYAAVTHSLLSRAIVVAIEHNSNNESAFIPGSYELRTGVTLTVPLPESDAQAFDQALEKQITADETNAAPTTTTPPTT